MNIHVSMFLKVLFIWVCVCGGYPVKWTTGITSPLTSCSPELPPHSLSLFSPAVQLFNFVTLTLRIWVWGSMSVQERVSLYISPLLPKQRMFCWGPFSVSASVIPIILPSVPAYGSPSAKPQEMRYSYHPGWGGRGWGGGMKRGICFTAVGDKAAEGITDDRKSMEERRRHREMRDEMKKKSGAMVMEIVRNNETGWIVFSWGLLVRHGGSHMESSTGVFFKNMFSQGSCCVIEIDLSAFSLVSMEGICPCEEKKNHPPSSLVTKQAWWPFIISTLMRIVLITDTIILSDASSIQWNHKLSDLHWTCMTWLAIIHIHSLPNRQWADTRERNQETLHNSILFPSNSVWFHENN